MTAKKKSTGPWQIVADASDRIEKLVTCIPGWDDYEHSGETLNELRRVAALLRQAIPLLEQAADREESRRSVDA
jgi:hypothetical protein